MKNSLKQASKPNCMPKHDIIANFSFAHDHYGAPSNATMPFFFRSSHFKKMIEMQKNEKRPAAKPNFVALFLASLLLIINF